MSERLAGGAPDFDVSYSVHIAVFTRVRRRPAMRRAAVKLFRCTVTNEIRSVVASLGEMCSPPPWRRLDRSTTTVRDCRTLHGTSCTAVVAVAAATLGGFHAHVPL